MYSISLNKPRLCAKLLLIPILFLPVLTVSPLASRAGAAPVHDDLVDTTLSEYSQYKFKNECSSSSMRQRIGAYWKALGSSRDGCTDVAWSAAFVSYMVRLAGAGAEFKYSAAHSEYIYNAFKGKGIYPSVASADTVSPRPGDLVCSGRSSYSSWDYDDFKDWAGRSYRFVSSHCDIVVEVQGNSVTAIGGNVSNQVKKRTNDRSFWAIVLQQGNGSAVNARTGPVVGKGQMCLDLPYNNSKNGTDLWIWTCNGSEAQQWTFEGTEIKIHGKCLDIEGREKSGSDVQITSCGYTGGLEWYTTSVGEIKTTKHSSLCLDIRWGSTEEKTKVQMYTCNGTAAQKWTTP